MSNSAPLNCLKLLDHRSNVSSLRDQLILPAQKRNFQFLLVEWTDCLRGADEGLHGLVEESLAWITTLTQLHEDLSVLGLIAVQPIDLNRAGDQIWGHLTWECVETLIGMVANTFLFARDSSMKLNEPVWSTFDELNHFHCLPAVLIQFVVISWELEVGVTQKKKALHTLIGPIEVLAGRDQSRGHSYCQQFQHGDRVPFTLITSTNSSALDSSTLYIHEESSKWLSLLISANICRH